MASNPVRNPGFRKILLLSAIWAAGGAAATWTWWTLGDRLIFSRGGPNVVLWLAIPVLTPLVAGGFHRSWKIGIATAIWIGVLWISAIGWAAATGALGVV